KVDGLDVLRRMKDTEKLRKIPVIMLTTTGEEDMIKQCYELGCCCYMVKPVDYHSFMEAVQNLGKFLSLEGMRLPSIGQPVS
ncbi:MAG: response regulator, partial [Planctomycetota bacterium]